MSGLELTLLVALVVALALGAIAHRLGMPPMLGYILAGIAVGPATPGFVAGREEVLALADIGVALLMFSIGLQFSLGELRSVGPRILGGTPLQVALTMGIGTATGLFMVPHSAMMLVAGTVGGLLGTRDVCWSMRDPRPLLTMPYTAWPILREAARKRVPFGEVATLDVGWLEEAAPMARDAAPGRAASRTSAVT